MDYHIGFSHIAFQVDDVNAIFDKALENGVSILGKVVEKKVDLRHTCSIPRIKFIFPTISKTGHKNLNFW